MKKFLAVSVATLALVSLGLVQIHCSSGDNGYECTTSADCDPGYYCDPEVHECFEETCTPECTNQCCGLDPLCGEPCPSDCPAGIVRSASVDAAFWSVAPPASPNGELESKSALFSPAATV